MTIPPGALPPHIDPQTVIRQKRDGRTLTSAEIEAFVAAVVERTPPGAQPPLSDAQIAAFLMAVFLRGLDRDELAALTQAMRFSGDTVPPPPPGTLYVDKHSTGGVGDKTSLLIAPILAAAGLGTLKPDGSPSLCVPMISGRALGHTGGTLDKLETIPGFNTQLSMEELAVTLRTCGAALIGQTPTLVPADRILYALRDHTGTVESPFLITASIMSKKLAESLNALVLDVKTGSGAFLRNDDEARLLARLMVETGEASGTRTVALLTDMSQPLGRFAGNWLEVQECVDILQQRRHPLSADLIELSNILAGSMLHLAGRAETPEAGAQLSDDLLTSGEAWQAWLKIVAAQGGDCSVFDDPNGDPSHPAQSGGSASASLRSGGSAPTLPCHPSQSGGSASASLRSGSSAPALPCHPSQSGGSASALTSVASTSLLAETSGFLHSIDTTAAGWAVQKLGAGRTRPGDPVSAHAGIEVHAKLGDPVTAGQTLFTLYADDPALLNEPLAMLRAAVRIAPERPIPVPLVREIIRQAER